MSSHRYKEQLCMQLGFLERSCTSFDTGVTDEGIRIATILRVLFHDTSNSTSLVKHLNARSIKLLSTVDHIPRQPSQECLVEFQGMGQHTLKEGEFVFEPVLYRTAADKELELDNWWNQPVAVLQIDTLVRRREIILTAANKDGGAHVDSSLTSEYAVLAKSGAFGNYINSGSNELAPIEDAHLVYLRQMGFEVLNSHELRQLAV